MPVAKSILLIQSSFTITFNIMSLLSQTLRNSILPTESEDASIPVPIRETDTWQGSEYLDDLIRTDDQEESLPSTQTT